MYCTEALQPLAMDSNLNLSSIRCQQEVTSMSDLLSLTLQDLHRQNYPCILQVRNVQVACCVTCQANVQDPKLGKQGGKKEISDEIFRGQVLRAKVIKKKKNRSNRVMYGMYRLFRLGASFVALIWIPSQNTHPRFKQGWTIPALQGLIGGTVLPQLTHLTPIIT